MSNTLVILKFSGISVLLLNGLYDTVTTTLGLVLRKVLHVCMYTCIRKESSAFLFR